MIKFECASLNDTKNAAEYFARFAKPGQCFALYGNLGSGKTTFSQFLIKSLIPTVEYISSPTFTIVQTYNDNNRLEIWHVDCYRLNNSEEFFELGLEEAFENCITIIEWPEIVDGFLPQNTIKIQFSMKCDNIRTISRK
jgi:tRNA threonylcarbamoyladenosine biosynthesis protein TsaE